MKLLPKKIVTLILSYSCKKCGNEYWVNKDEACVSGFMFVCGSCKTVNAIEPIVIKHTMHPINQSQDNINSKPNALNETQININKIIKILRGYGYGVREIKPIIDDCLRKGVVKTEQDLIKYVVSTLV
jgi:transcription initiation factor TFIIIB Brf1 subunit/transcription initiation factor TFIIB